MPPDMVPRHHDVRGNTWNVQRGSGHLAASGVSGHGGPGNHEAPGEANQSVKGRLCVSASASHGMGRRPSGGQGQHRTGDIPRSGIAGGPAETWTMGERGTHLAYRKSACWKLS